MDDDLGYTNVMVNSRAGNTFINCIGDKLEIHKVDLDTQIRLDGIMVENSAIPNKNRDYFYEELNKVGIEKTVEKYISISNKDVLIEKSKNIMYKTRVLGLIKKFRRK